MILSCPLSLSAQGKRDAISELSGLPNVLETVGNMAAASLVPRAIAQIAEHGR